MRYFSDQYYINRRVSDLGIEPKLQPYVERLLKYGNGFVQPPDFRIPTLAYTNPIVYVKDAITTAKVFQRDDIKAKMTIGNVGKGGVIPWNPAWLKMAAQGYDGLLTIVDEEKGTFIELWMVDQLPIWWNYLNCIFEIGSGPTVGVGTAYKWNTLWTEKDNTALKGRGCGLVKMAGTVLIKELEVGVIDHAIGWYCPVPMFGPSIVDPPTNYNDPEAGTTKGWYFKGSATRLEHRYPTVTLQKGDVATTWAPDDRHRGYSQPSGIRFAHTRSNLSIDAWIKQRGFTGARAISAKTYAIALRDYGFFYGDTCGPGGSSFEFEGSNASGANFNNTDRVKKLGLRISVDYADDLLTGLFMLDNTVVVKPLV